MKICTYVILVQKVWSKRDYEIDVYDKTAHALRTNRTKKFGEKVYEIWMPYANWVRRLQRLEGLRKGREYKYLDARKENSYKIFGRKSSRDLPTQLSYE